MSDPVSVRFPDAVARRLRRLGTDSDESTSGLVVRLVDEGMRMGEHPGIVFREGPTGRRAGLTSGPDVWEVIMVLRDFANTGPADAVRRTARSLSLSDAQVRTAESYYSAYFAEVDERITNNRDAAEAAQKADEVRRRLYS
jgi:hypothetical protein